MNPAWEGLLLTLSVAAVPAVLGLALVDRIMGRRHPRFMRGAWRTFYLGMAATFFGGAVQIAVTGEGLSCGLEGSAAGPWSAFWLSGVALLSAGRIWHVVRSEKVLRRLSRAPSDSVVREVCDQLKISCPELRRDGRGRSPYVARAWRPILVLPSSFGKLPVEIRRAILGHELAHLKDSDLLWDRLENIVRLLFFFHPFLWMARILSDRAVERAADARAVRTAGIPAHDLAKALIRVACAGEMAASARAWSRGGAGLRDRLLGLEQLAASGSKRNFFGAATLAVFAACLVPAAAATAWPSPPERHGGLCVMGRGQDLIRHVLNSSEPEKPYSSR